MTTVLSLTVMAAVRGVALPLAATRNETGLSPLRGIDVNTVIHDADVWAVQMHASCSGPPQLMSVVVW